MVQCHLSSVLLCNADFLTVSLKGLETWFFGNGGTAMFQMGEVSRRLGLNRQTLYFYERIGLIPSPQRTTAGYRLFSEEDVERLDFIVRAKSLGLTLDEIKEILALKDGRSLTCQIVHDLLSKKVREIEENILQLEVLRDELVPLIALCRANLDANKECLVLEEREDESGSAGLMV